MSLRLREIHVYVIEHNDQRYDTVGDWLINEETGELHVLVSQLGNDRMNAACALHEITEGLLCLFGNVPEETVSEFDRLYEGRRPGDTLKSDGLIARFGCTCEVTDDSEPGGDVHAPYRRQHAVGDIVERTFAAAADLPWAAYDSRVNSLEWRPPVSDDEMREPSAEAVRQYEPDALHASKPQ